MALPRPDRTKACEVLDFKGAAAGPQGRIGWQIHNQGLFGEYRDVRIEENPQDDRIIAAESGGRFSVSCTARK